LAGTTGAGLGSFSESLFLNIGSTILRLSDPGTGVAEVLDLSGLFIWSVPTGVAPPTGVMIGWTG
jgi:hypothetical protein